MAAQTYPSLLTTLGNPVPLDLVNTLCDLVAIPSVNAMGRKADADAEFGERRIGDYLENLLARLGLPVARQPVHPGRDNILARLDGRGSDELIMFSVHQDTVPVDGMTIEPFTPRIDDGRLYGRGSCDIKGGMAAMLVAIGRLAEERPRNMPSIVLACTVNEEYGFSGAKAIRDLCLAEGDEMITRRPDAAIIAEPTDLNVVVAHKGVVRWRCHTRGQAVHASCPEAGENAIYKMGRVLTALERYQREVAPGLASHPRCGSSTISVGMIHGGISVNIVPDRCTIEIDRRLPAGEEIETARRHLADYLQASVESNICVEHEPPYMYGPPLSDEHNGRLACRLSDIAREVAGRSDLTGAPYSTDAGFIGQAVPCVVFGPGSIAQAHTKDEWIALDELHKAAEIYYRLGKTGLDG